MIDKKKNWVFQRGIEEGRDPKEEEWGSWKENNDRYGNSQCKKNANVDKPERRGGDATKEVWNVKRDRWREVEYYGILVRTGRADNITGIQKKNNL